MPGIVKDTRFWWGVAAGFFVGPIVAKTVSMQLQKLRARNGG